jgi:hypothetical protein
MQKNKLRALARALTTPVRTSPILIDEAPPSTRRAAQDWRRPYVDDSDDGPLTVRP